MRCPKCKTHVNDGDIIEAVVYFCNVSLEGGELVRHAPYPADDPSLLSCPAYTCNECNAEFDQFYEESHEITVNIYLMYSERPAFTFHTVPDDKPKILELIRKASRMFDEQYGEKGTLPEKVEYIEEAIIEFLEEEDVYYRLDSKRGEDIYV